MAVLEVPLATLRDVLRWQAVDPSKMVELWAIIEEQNIDAETKEAAVALLSALATPGGA